MKTWLATTWDQWRSSFWFLPALLMLLALGLGFVMPLVDGHVVLERSQGIVPAWIVTTAPAARATLAALAGALITVASVVFSVTMVTLSLTTSNYGSRLLRSFLNQNITQVTMGSFLAASLYCVLILKAVRTIDGTAFVPHLSVALGVVWAVFATGIFIAFIHTVATSVQAQNVVRAVAVELDEVIDRLYPEQRSTRAAADKSRQTADTIAAEDHRSPSQGSDDIDQAANVHEIVSQQNGYLVAVDDETLLKVATEFDGVLRMKRRAGHFLVDGDLLATWQHLSSATYDAQEITDRVNRALVTGPRRMPRQDVECAILELVEVAVRALSPGINDPFTAIACIDYLGNSLAKLALRPPPETVLPDPDGQVRVLLSFPEFPRVMDAAFRLIRQFGEDSPAILIRLLESLRSVAARVQTPGDREAVLEQVEIVRRTGERCVSEPSDLADITQVADEVTRQLGGEVRACVCPTAS